MFNLTHQQQKMILSEFVALIQQKYKIELVNFIFENKFEYKILKPNFDIQIYTDSEAETHKRLFVINFFYLKITRFVY